MLQLLLSNVVVNSSDYSGVLDVYGCMDENASNYNSEANVQGYDQYGNLQCVYASCDDIPEYGCIYADGFGAFAQGFGPSECTQYGGTPCEEEVDGVYVWMRMQQIIMQMQQYRVMIHTETYSVFMLHVMIFQNMDVFT